MDERIAVFGMALSRQLQDEQKAAGVEASLIMLMSDVDDPTDCFTAIVTDGLSVEEMTILHQSAFGTMAVVLTKLIGKEGVLNLVSQAFAAVDDYEEIPNPFLEMNGKLQ